MLKITLLQKINTKLKTIFKFLFTLFIIFNLSSCAISSSKIEALSNNSFYKNTDNIKNLNSWKIQGVIGIRYNSKAQSANYIWAQDKNKFDINLYGPLGIGAVDIKGNKNEVTLINSKGVTKSKNVEELLFSQLGWIVPVDGMKSWIKGIPTNKNYKGTKNSNNLFYNLKQNGWNIKIKDYVLVDDKYPLPTKITMTRGDLWVKLIIKSWKVNNISL